jgi:hypothetical protein
VGPSSCTGSPKAGLRTPGKRPWSLGTSANSAASIRPACRRAIRRVRVTSCYDAAMSPTCAECGQSATRSCRKCGEPKCIMHLVQTYHKRDTGMAVGGWRVTQEGYESTDICIACRDRRQFGVAEALRTETNPTRIAARLSAGPATDVGAPTNVAAGQAFGRAVREAWAGLVARGAVGNPTHDVLELKVSGKKARLSFTEISRMAAWLAPNAGRYSDEHRMHVWVGAEGTVWAPLIAADESGGGFRVFKRDMSGRVYEPDPLIVAVESGARLRTQTVGAYYERSCELVEGTVVTTRHAFQAPFSPEYNLREAAAAVVQRTLARAS